MDHGYTTEYGATDVKDGRMSDLLGDRLYLPGFL